MDTCNKISKFFKDHDFECRVIGVPKTIDNDLTGTDHSPGYGSAARYVATTLMEIFMMYSNDKNDYYCRNVGRNAGWLTAAFALAQSKGQGQI